MPPVALKPEQFHPTANRVVILPDAAPEKSEGGIHLVQESTEVPTWGEVVRIGPDVKRTQVGDRVLFGRFSGFPFSIDKVQHVLVVEEEILGTFAPSF